MARFYERHRRPSQDALWADIAVLAAAGEEGDRTDAGEGFWLGRMITAEGEGGRTIKLRNIRTWLAH